MNGLSLAVVAALQAAVVVMLGVAVRDDNGAAVVNALVVLVAAVALTALAYLPGWGPHVGPALPLWFSLAGVLHTAGMLGPYDTVWWWDHLTHTVSAAMVAAVVYAWVLVRGPASGPVAAGAVTLGITLVVGGTWELVELLARQVGERIDVEPVLVVYGWRDTAFDIAFDVLGALVVVALDLRLFVPLVERIT